MMDFDNVLSIATQNRGDSHVQKRYSLQAGPPKKDPKSKGVNPAAIQALLKKQQLDNRKKETEFKKQKDELLAKRVELKSDRKARAMASRTKDNFKGYNGIPIVEGPKKRRTKQEMQEEARRNNPEQFGNDVIDPEDDEDNYEYEQSGSESEPEQEPQRNSFNSGSGSFKASAKLSAAPKPAAPLNFADLLKLAEKKQHEPVEMKPKVVKKEERLRTAEELREMELERKARKLGKDVRGESSYSNSSSSKSIQDRNDKPRMSGSLDKQLHVKKDKGESSSKSSINDRDKVKSFHKDKDRGKQSSSGSSNAINNKMSPRPTHSHVSSKQMGTKLSSSNKEATSLDHTAKKDNFQKRPSSTNENRPSSSSFMSPKNQISNREGPQRPITNASAKSSMTKPGGSSSCKPTQPHARPGGPPQIKSGARPGVSGARPQGTEQSRPSNRGPTSGRADSSFGGGPGTPRCTVVSETISSKNMVGAKMGMGVTPRPGLPQKSGEQPRPGVRSRPEGPPRPGQQQRPEGPPRSGMQQRPEGPPRSGLQQRPGGVPPRPGLQQRPDGPPRPGLQQRPGGVPPRPGMQQRQGVPPRPGMQQRPDGQLRAGMQQPRPGVPPRPGMPQRPGLQQRPGMPPRPMNRPPGPMLPPITSAYKS